MPCSILQDSAYNLDPETPNMVDEFTAAMLEREGKELSDLETEIVQAPFVQVSLRRKGALVYITVAVVSSQGLYFWL